VKYLIIITFVVVFSKFNTRFLSKLNLKKKFSNFFNSFANFKNKNNNIKKNYTEILDKISLDGSLLIFFLLISLVPWFIIFSLGKLFNINFFLTFSFASFPYLSLVKLRYKK
tara:strand:- start:100 stop:435 length:336 start_codon:yes stop_codon:yes gene_type:complete